MEALLQDMGEVVEYLRSFYNREKIIILGHSWGSVLSAAYVLRHPEQVALYIGYGNCTNIKRNEEETDALLLEAIEKAGNARDKAAFEALKAIPGTYIDITNKDYKKKLFGMGRLKVKYGIFVQDPKTLNRDWQRSPSFKLSDASILFPSSRVYNKDLTRYLADWDILNWNGRQEGASFAVPLCWIQGEKDNTTKTSLAAEHFARISAPAKLYREIPGGGHNTAYFEPEAFAAALEEALGLIS
jgi:pimeloyl-ACP methyl ester carboxylesterase